MAASDVGIADSHQLGAEDASILLPGSPIKVGIVRFPDRAQSLLLTHGNFLRKKISCFR
ncbi:hypothetical protein [Massilia aerilata]|uniref:Uncharacterized protein n=1 Tax=Massilia aerilata TaxID=453817 RepID=A0ABW0RRA6_9BURK